MDSPNATLAIGRAVLVFLSINDVYSLTPVAGKGGIAELATALKQERAAIRAQHPGAHIITTGFFFIILFWFAFVQYPQMPRMPMV